MGVGPRRSQRETWLGPRCPSLSCARTAPRSIGSSPARPRAAGPLSCAPMRGAAPTTPRRASASAAGSTSTAEARCAWCPATPPVPSPTSTSRTKGCGSVTAQRPPGPCRWLSARHRRQGRRIGTAGSAPRPRVTGCSQYVRRTGRDPPGRCAAWLPSPLVPGRPASPRCSRDTTSSGRRDPTPTATGSPSSPGITPTCRGMPRLSCSCRSAAPPAPCTRPGTRPFAASGPVQRAAGGPAESVGQPSWARDGSLRFVSDRTGWWQPYRHSGRLGTDEAPLPLTATEAEFHGPDWVLSQQTMAETNDGALVARMTSAGRDALVRLDPDGNAKPLAQPCVSVAALCAHADGIALIGSTPDVPSTVWLWDPEDGARRLRPQAPVALGAGDVAVGEPFTLSGRSGRPVHGTLFRPTLGDWRGPAGTAASAGDLVPRWPHVVVPGRARPDAAVLHHAGVCRGLRRLCRQLGLRASPTAAPFGASGASPTRKTASMRLSSWRPGGTSTRRGWPSVAAVRVE